MNKSRRGLAAADGELTLDSGALARLTPTYKDRVVTRLHGNLAVMIYLAQLRGLERKEYVSRLAGLELDSLQSTQRAQRLAILLWSAKIKLDHLVSAPFSGIGHVGFDGQRLRRPDGRLG